VLGLVLQEEPAAATAEIEELQGHHKMQVREEQLALEVVEPHPSA